MASLYVHIPFCEKKCLYCDFYSIETSSLMNDFLEALKKNIQAYAQYGSTKSFDTIFFGGGTPSLLTPTQLESILNQLRATYSISDSAEITVETNPGTVTKEKLVAYRTIGANRLSIGIQSFHEDELHFLSRIHDAKQAIECVEFARAAGFDNVNLDFIYALPGQTMERWAENLRKAVALAPEHISAYGLIVEDNTPLARMVSSKLVTPKPVDEEAEFFEFTMEFLEERGFEHYEVSNYAKPGYRCRHNLTYWRHEDYLGFGPSAHSFWRDRNAARRWSNIVNLSMYISGYVNNKPPLALDEVIGEEQLLTERVFLGLRSDGVDLRQLASAFPRKNFREDLVPVLVQNGSATLDDGTLRLTRKGYLICDEIVTRLLT